MIVTLKEPTTPFDFSEPVFDPVGRAVEVGDGAAGTKEPHSKLRPLRGLSTKTRIFGEGSKATGEDVQ
jgi:hypothetical protein